jgi:hypothetical protein
MGLAMSSIRRVPMCPCGSCGKIEVRFAPLTRDESGGKVTLTGGPQSMLLTIDSDGNLNGPPESIGKLVKKK